MWFSGGYNPQEGYQLQETEVYSVLSDTFQLGPNLPRRMYNFCSLTKPGQEYAYIIGGKASGGEEWGDKELGGGAKGLQSYLFAQKVHNLKVSEFEWAQIWMCKNLKVSESEYVQIHVHLKVLGHEIGWIRNYK